MTRGIEGFQRLLGLFRSSSTWATAGLTAVPFATALAELSPPWPPGVVALTAIVQLVVLALAYQACRGLRGARIVWLMSAGMLVAVLASGLYLQQLSAHTYRVPTTGERFAMGTTCTADARAVFGSECPALGVDALRSAEYEAERLWTPASVTAMRLRLVALWSVAFAALAWTLGVFFVHQIGRTPARRPAAVPAGAADARGVDDALEVFGRNAGDGARPGFGEAAPAGSAPPSAHASPPASMPAPPAPSMPAPMPPLRGPGGGLLGEEAATAAPDLPMSAGAEPGPEPQPDAGEASRWINARIEDHPAGTALRLAQTYTLAFAIEAVADSNLGASGSAPSAAPATDAEYALTVQLDSDDFSIGDRQRPLRVLPGGLSAGKARFDITPLHDGAGRITATFHKDGNFVQRMVLTLQVGDAARVQPDVQRSGRPLAALATLRRRDIGISVEPAPGGGFECTVWGMAQARAKLPIQDTELADAIEQLRRALMKVVTRQDDAGTYPFQDAIAIAPSERDAALRVLAKAGFTLYRLLFHHPAADRQCKEIGNWLCRQARDPALVLDLQVIGTSFPVPWALLYLAERWDDATLDWDGFLGMRHVVEQIPLQNDMGLVDGRIEEADDGLSVSLNLNLDIDRQMSLDVVQRQAAYWDTLAASRPTLRVTRRTTGAALLGALGDPRTDDEILYLYCHATAVGLDGTGGPNASSLRLDADTSLTLQDLNLYADTDRKLAGHPLVFINACESADLSPLFYNGFVPYFMSKGARGVIGTECKMPALFAAEWARAFFDALLAGKPLGDTVLALRRSFLSDHGNPLGLLYGLHCNADTQVVPAVTP